MPDSNRLRPRELFFVFLGVATGASTAVLWFGLVPELMRQKGLDLAALDGLGALVMNPALQIAVLVLGAVVLSAGIATRTASGQNKATWILAGGSVLLFASLLLSVNALYDPVFLDVDPAGEGDADDWDDSEPGSSVE